MVIREEIERLKAENRECYEVDILRGGEIELSQKVDECWEFDRLRVTFDEIIDLALKALDAEGCRVSPAFIITSVAE